MSSSDRERWNEENRRKLRKDEVVIGKTSAKEGATDYKLDPDATQEQLLRQMSNSEQKVFKLTETGIGFLNSLRIEEANEAFDQVYGLKPTSYLWQAGIVKFYLEEYFDAAELFSRNAKIYESRFGGPASEERIWRDACFLKLLSSSPKREKKDMISKINSIIADDQPDNDLPNETRRVIKASRELFGASVDSDISSQLIARAKLRSIAGSQGESTILDRKMWKLSSWFYLGLHYDCLGDFEESKKCMKMALKLCPSSGKSDDIIHTLPLLHMSTRDWFDDDNFEDDPFVKELDSETDGDFTPAHPSFPQSSMAYSDPLIEESIMEGVSSMRLAELKEALKLRGLKIVGSKETLQERLFFSLMDDSGFQSGFAP